MACGADMSGINHGCEDENQPPAAPGDARGQTDSRCTVSLDSGPDFQCLLRCLRSTRARANWDHWDAFDKQAPECFYSQQAILTFAMRGRRRASSQITHHGVSQNM
ncbi:hypothetical protein EYF80_018932 [Liparis tanakae]|uniref:Uncharacterized protein n=1 Tax=Liparis tanakae TaxID=230148 RepID=A0A4Z2HYR1_9TELE|nr:hypothetical protein EYF80_018932 [Liparis tanakae]